MLFKRMYRRRVRREQEIAQNKAALDIYREVYVEQIKKHGFSEQADNKARAAATNLANYFGF